MDLPIALLSLIGFGIALYVHLAGAERTKFLCVFGEDCTAVIKSHFNHIFYLRNTWWGMIAFIVLFFSGVLAGVTHNETQYAFHLIEQATAITAAVVGLYLTGVQIFILKKFCSWCLMANCIAIGISILLLY